MKDYIRVKLVGGLGNQLFIWATAFAVSKRRKVDLVLDASECTAWGDQLIDFGIQVSIPGPKIPNKELPSRFGFETNLIIRLFRIFREKYRNLRIGMNYWENPKKSFDNSIFDIPVGKQLRGYFQSYKYFEDFENEIRMILTREAYRSNDFVSLASKMPEEWLAISVRRGEDYKKMSGEFGLQSDNYFMSAILEVEKLRPALFKCVFSDNISEAREMIPGCDLYIGRDQLSSPVERLLLMSKASAFIGSNSSFSWWGAYLMNCPEPIRIFPDPWFINEALNTQDLVPPNWIRLKNI